MGKQLHYQEQKLKEKVSIAAMERQAVYCYPTFEPHRSVD